MTEIKRQTAEVKSIISRDNHNNSSSSGNTVSLLPYVSIMLRKLARKVIFCQNGAFPWQLADVHYERTGYV